MHSSDTFAAQVAQSGSCIMLGLDPDIARLPTSMQAGGFDQLADFCHTLLEACAPWVCGVKLQLGCFEVYGARGTALVEALLARAGELNLIRLVDGKRGDIASTAAFYARAYLAPNSPLAADALTVNPLLGADSLRPFVDAAATHQRMLFVLVHTSNPDAQMFQPRIQAPLVKMINTFNAEDLGEAGLGRVGAVVGATRGAQLAGWREQLPHSWLLTPGLGAQQGNPDELRKLRHNGASILVPVSRAIMYAGSGKDYAQQSAAAARHYRDLLNGT